MWKSQEKQEILQKSVIYNTNIGKEMAKKLTSEGNPNQ